MEEFLRVNISEACSVNFIQTGFYYLNISLKGAIFWNVTSCSLAEIYGCFGGAYSFLLQLAAFCVLGILTDPEYGGCSLQPPAHAGSSLTDLYFRLVAHSAATCSRWFLAHGFMFSIGGSVCSHLFTLVPRSRIYIFDWWLSLQPSVHAGSSLADLYFRLVAQSAATCSRWFLAHGFFYPEDEGDMFLRNVGLHKIYTAPHLEDGILHTKVGVAFEKTVFNVVFARYKLMGLF
jgi:hypothetical protein